MTLLAMGRIKTPFKFLLILVSLTLSGCGYSAAEHRVTSTTARTTLESVLKSWQAGESSESWQQKTPKVVVQDMDWRAGAKLQSFEILGEGEAIDANLHCQVKLKFAQPQNGKKEITVTYLVGTSPVLTVFRELGQ
ncbi:MAG: hypothetical protein SFV81_21430 [Pirellulaceae bacterium]|nr:hypothetical protein [Pirellulaceae bacterium]